MVAKERGLTAQSDDNAAVLERVVIQGDLAKLRPEDRVAYYKAVCESLGLNPLSKPFQYIVLNNRLTLYATRTATDQLRAIKGISIDRIDQEEVAGLYVATVYGHDRTSRTDSEVGAVSIANLKGDARANAMMKAITKSKRRLTLSLAGLGWLDETEVGTIPQAQAVEVNQETGEVAPSRQEQVAEKRDTVNGSGPTSHRATEGSGPAVDRPSGRPGRDGADHDSEPPPEGPPHPVDYGPALEYPADYAAERPGSAQATEAPDSSPRAGGPAPKAGARADTPASAPGSTDSSKPKPAPDAGPPTATMGTGAPAAERSQEAATTEGSNRPAEHVRADGSAPRCEGFNDPLGPCVREPGHTGNHANKNKETWK